MSWDNLNKFMFVITEDLENERLDKCLNSLMEDLSRSYLQKLLSSGSITVNGKQMKSSYRVKTEDQIQLILPPVSLPDIAPENIPLEVLYEDKSVIVVNKPKGMVVHPAPVHYGGTLVNALLYHCKGELSGINGILRPGIVHRIDRDTTGSVIACKNDKAHACIAEQLKQHTIVRRYHAIVHGRLKEEQGTIHAFIGRHPTDRKRMSVLTSGGKEAITHYKVLKQLGNYSYIECRLETGRTHQIRVHMAYLGHPLLGDAVYGPKNCPFPLQGQTLHAKILGFTHPETGAYLETDAPLPQYFQELLSKHLKII